MNNDAANSASQMDLQVYMLFDMGAPPAPCHRSTTCFYTILLSDAQHAHAAFASFYAALIWITLLTMFT